MKTRHISRDSDFSCTPTFPACRKAFRSRRGALLPAATSLYSSSIAWSVHWTFRPNAAEFRPTAVRSRCPISDIHPCAWSHSLSNSRLSDTTSILSEAEPRTTDAPFRALNMYSSASGRCRTSVLSYPVAPGLPLSQNQVCYCLMIVGFACLGGPDGFPAAPTFALSGSLHCTVRSPTGRPFRLSRSETGSGNRAGWIVANSKKKGSPTVCCLVVTTPSSL